MALKPASISILLLLNISLAMAGEALAGGSGLTKPKEEDVKHPEWFIDPDGSVNIPGVGRISYVNPSYGNSRGGSGIHYIPGFDDTFVPNPGFEVPVPSKSDP